MFLKNIKKIFIVLAILSFANTVKADAQVIINSSLYILTSTSLDITAEAVGFTAPETFVAKYGTSNTSLNQTSNQVSIQADSSFHLVINGLTPGTTYFFQIASKSGSPTYTPIGEFITPTGSSGNAEIIVDSSQLVLTSTSLDIVADVLGFTSASSIVVKYGTSISSLNQTVDPIQVQPNTTFHALISGLTPDTNYFYQIASANGSTIYTPTTPFTTPIGTNSGEISINLNDSILSTTSLILKGEVIDFTTPETVEVKYGTSENEMTQTSGPIQVQLNEPFLAEIAGLEIGTNYVFKVVSTTNGTVYVQPTSFTTPTAGSNISLADGATQAPVCTNGADGYCLLAPLGGVSVIKDVDLDGYFGMVYKILIGLAGVLAVIMIFYGGVQYMTTDALFEKELGRKTITNAVIGLIIALGSFAILNTFNPKLLNFTFFGLNSVTATFDPSLIESDTPHSAVGGKYCIKQGGGYLDGATWGDDAAERAQLASTNLNVTVKNNPVCQTVGQQNCTSVKSLNTVGITKLRTACASCELVITGGTECWLHSAISTHGKNSATVDLRNTGTPNLTAFIEKPENKKRVIQGWGTLYVTNGMEFIDEGDHYHVWGWNNEHAGKY